MNDRWLCILLLIFSLPLFAQGERRQLYGKIISDEAGVNGVFIINKSIGEETKSSAKGDFSIYAGAGDVLVIYKPGVSKRELKVNKDNLSTMPFIVSVTAEARELKEVIIEKQIDAVSLGIVPADQKKYTHAERKLYTAGDFKPISLLGILGGSLPLDPIINAINGKTKRLKKEVALERKGFLTEKVYGIYTEQEITQEFKIPEEYVKGFVFYLAEDAEFTNAVNADEIEGAKFRMAALAEKYLVLIENKK